MGAYITRAAEGFSKQECNKAAGIIPKNQKAPYDYLFKLVIIGDCGVGKSSLLLRITENTFSNCCTTMALDFKTRTKRTKDGKLAKLQIWDTAGQDRFRPLTNTFYRKANAILIVFDLTNVESFNNVSKWIQNIDKFSEDSSLKILVGNKADSSSRRVKQEDAKNLALRLNMMYIETSAKSSFNVEELVSVAIEELRKIEQK
eukprot:TRINITY_DN12354_c0_g1_i1.p1 TRINITY_DN12354_c0_g1~~TRINITY_DN12354_c0_g1_i1.p1  ORF type:complete len:202 (+),score=27.96 TRINITY_DN12354_c0_g1_i1:60-665(+)